RGRARLLRGAGSRPEREADARRAIALPRRAARAPLRRRARDGTLRARGPQPRRQRLRAASRTAARLPARAWLRPAGVGVARSSSGARAPTTGDPRGDLARG